MAQRWKNNQKLLPGHTKNGGSKPAPRGPKRVQKGPKKLRTSPTTSKRPRALRSCCFAITAVGAARSTTVIRPRRGEPHKTTLAGGGQCEPLTRHQGEGWGAPHPMGGCKGRTAHHWGTRVVPPGASASVIGPPVEFSSSYFYTIVS